ncbi:hypothetical protein [Allosphingosinicella deserti]|nr:hypothetical protein [Sphingomonas deserti]
MRIARYDILIRDCRIANCIIGADAAGIIGTRKAQPAIAPARQGGYASAA